MVPIVYALAQLVLSFRGQCHLPDSNLVNQVVDAVVSALLAEFVAESEVGLKKLLSGQALVRFPVN